VGATRLLGGTVVAYREVTLNAELPGRVIQIAGSEGSPVKQNQELVRIDTAELQAQRDAALAEVANAESLWRTAYFQYGRELWSPQSQSLQGGMGMPSLFDQMFTKPAAGVVGVNNQQVERSADLQTASGRIEQARNTYFRMLSQLQRIDAKLRDAVTVAPIDGVIAKKFIEVGDTVQPGQRLLLVVDNDRLQVQVEVPSNLMAGIAEGMPWVQVKLDVRDVIVPGRLAQIFPTADPQRHTTTVKFDLPSGTSARPGTYAEVTMPDISVQPRPSLIIPRQAVTWRGSLPAVEIKTAQGKELRLIRLGTDLDSNYVSVLSGLQAGEQVIVERAATEIRH
jgi:multidrug efflux pump subunit AcrA (membrane-fusion protein)